MKNVSRALTCFVCLVAVATAGFAAKGAPETDEEKTIYALGASIAGQLQPFDLSDADLDVLVAGLRDGVAGGDLAVDLATWQPKIQQLAQQRATQAAATEKAAAGKVLAKAASRADTTEYDSGLIMKTLEPGDGASPAEDDMVKVHYTGKLRDGTVFDSSVERGQPAEFPLNRVIPCWTEALQKMEVGGKARIWCPSDIAYGDQGRPGTIPGGATLIFDVELLDIVQQ